MSLNYLNIIIKRDSHLRNPALRNLKCEFLFGNYDFNKSFGFLMLQNIIINYISIIMIKHLII